MVFLFLKLYFFETCIEISFTDLIDCAIYHVLMWQPQQIRRFNLEYPLKFWQILYFVFSQIFMFFWEKNV